MTTQTPNSNSFKEYLICGTIILNAEDNVIFFDQTAKHLLGVGNIDEISRKTISEFFQLSLPSLNLSYKSKVFAKTISFSRNKKKYLYHIELVPMEGDGSEINGRILKIQDITNIQKMLLRQKKTEETLSQAQQQAKMVDIIKSSFFNTINHEIRTPIGAIVGMSHLLRDTPLNSEQVELLESIISNSDELLGIIKNILEFSKIENGELKLDNQPFDFRDSLETIFKPYLETATEKALQFNYQISEHIPNFFYGDPIRLQQILVHILNNAFKYTDQGKITVKIASRKIDKKETELFFSIEDTGIGIPQLAIENLFQPFTQSVEYKTRKYGGTGLGLAITKKLCELMNGRIWVQSEVGKGSTFKFTITLKLTENTPTRYLQPHSISLRGKRILIIAQNAEHRRVLKRETRSAGMSPYIAGSYSEVTYWLNRAPYDLAILDSQLFDSQANDLIAHVAHLAPKLPILLMGEKKKLTTHANNPQIAALINLPIVTSNLYDVFINVLAMRIIGQNEKQHFSPEEKLIEMGKRHPLNLLMVEDNPINQKVARRLLERLGYQLDIAQNGIEGLHAINQKLYDVVLMDIQMPEMDGLETTRQIRQNFDKSKQPRIIAVTAHAMEGDREEYIEAGMDDYISKPMKIDALVAALHKCKPQIR